MIFNSLRLDALHLICYLKAHIQLIHVHEWNTVIIVNNNNNNIIIIIFIIRL